MPSTSDIIAAHNRIAPHIHRTPSMETGALGLADKVTLKLENTQVTGTFKARGAFNTLLASSVPSAGVVAASGGNHGIAVAHAALSLGHPAKIFVPEIAGPSKIALIRATGADLTVVPGAYANALELAQAHEEATGAMQIHAYDAELTVGGQGTLAKEWEEQVPDGLDTVLIAVGGGGLIAGALAWLQTRAKLIAVESTGCPTLNAALAAGRPVDVDVSGIAANALGAQKIGRICFDLASRHLSESVLVDDDAIADAQRRLWNGARQWVEPAGATALAALTSGIYTPRPGERVGVLVCGANPSPGPFD
ncbi:MAG: threonine/serine dehydratase [Rhodobacteraceae bacterium]|nr:MAG: threonine/serine dehydratase [Paracoccaceae bacterium]